ncbi:MAG TPA: hypothetical protein VLA72_19240 [Anaerolineales bacterium]|nr:hypothetical protein [Anaerolineales bacterium]
MSNTKSIRYGWIIIVLMGSGLIALLISSTRAELARNPSRQAMADMDRYGFITVSLETDPYPARPTGMVGLSFMLMNSNNVRFMPDSFSYEYGLVGDDQPVGFGTAMPMADGSGMLMAGEQFPYAGKWWLRVYISKDEYQDDVQFTIDVQPAQ